MTASSTADTSQVGPIGATRTDGADFSQFVAVMWPRLVRTSRLSGASSQEAEDLAQTALEQAFRHWRRVSRASDPQAYVFSMLFNATSRARRRRWNGEVSASDTIWLNDERLERQTSEADLTEQVDVRHALRSLPYDQRVVLVLRFGQDLSERQVAEILKIPPGTVKSRTARGLSALRTLQFTVQKSGETHEPPVRQ